MDLFTATGLAASREGTPTGPYNTLLWEQIQVEAEAQLSCRLSFVFVSENTAFLRSEPGEGQSLAFGDGVFHLSSETSPIARLLSNPFHVSVDLFFYSIWFLSIQSSSMMGF